MEEINMRKVWANIPMDKGRTFVKEQHKQQKIGRWKVDEEKTDKL